MQRYEVKGKSKQGGRRRTRVFSADSEDVARLFADADGMTVEQIEELPPEPPVPPTERQLAYAKDLGIQIPENATLEEVSALLTLRLDHDKPATERHKAFAARYGIPDQKLIGKKALFDQIYAAVMQPGREKDLLAWFAFRVYRSLVKGVMNVPIGGPEHSTIQEVAAACVGDQTVLKSIRRYAGRELIWFGEFVSPDGISHQGASTKTIAYEKVARLLRNKAGLPGHRMASSVRRSSPSSQVGGLAYRLGGWIERFIRARIDRLARPRVVSPTPTGPSCPQCHVPVPVTRPICPKCGQRVRLSRPA